jgi:DNA-binding IclR family transcriptional regulator
MEQDPAPALGRGLQLLMHLGRSGATSLERLSADCGIPKSSCTRLLRSLELAGLVHRESVSKRFVAMQRLVPVQLGPQAFQQRLRQEMHVLTQAFNCTTECWWPGEQSLTLMERCEPEQAEIRIHARIGYPRDLSELEAVTQALLAWTPSPGIRHWRWNGAGDQQRLKKAEVLERLALVRQRGWAMDDNANSNQVQRLALPIAAGQPERYGILAIAVLTWPQDPQQLATELQATTARLTAGAVR